MELRRISHLLLNGYHNNHLLISTSSDTIAHFAGISIFYKIDCSRAYPCVQNVYLFSVQLLAFSFPSRTFAQHRLVRGLNRSVTGFSALVRNYLEPCLSTNVCTQFIDAIGCRLDSIEQLITSLRLVLSCLLVSGLKLPPKKCVFGQKKYSFLGTS